MAGPNFGTGSSREHAVWAIMDYGFQAVISPRFADIFRNNCTKNGLVPVAVSAEVGRAAAAAPSRPTPTLEITIDVERRTVEAPAIGHRGRVPARRLHPHRFLEGLDDIGITLRTRDAIDAYERTAARLADLRLRRRQPEQRPRWHPDRRRRT